MQGSWFPSGLPVNRIGHMEVTDRELSVSHDDTVTSNINISLLVAADVDLRRFPFDRQRLKLAVESFLWPENVLVIVPEPQATGFAHDFSIPEWDIERVGTRIVSSSALRSGKPARLNFFDLIETSRGLLRFSASPFAFADSLKLLLAPLHLKDTPDVAPSWLFLFNFAVLSLRHLNEPPRIRKLGRQRSFSVSGPSSGFV
jgi:hypothetical protein